MLGLIQTCYKMDEALKSSIMNIYNYNTIVISELPTNLTLEELDNTYKAQCRDLEIKVNEEYRDKIDNLINELKKQYNK